MTEATFICRVCGSRQFFHAGITHRGFIGQTESDVDPQIHHELVHLYSCASCTSVFILPAAFSVLDKLESPNEEEIIPSTHPSHAAEDD
jgi:hypothetical protein